MCWVKISSHISTRRFFSLYEDIKTILFLRSFPNSFLVFTVFPNVYVYMFTLSTFVLWRFFLSLAFSTLHRSPFVDDVNFPLDCARKRQRLKVKVGTENNWNWDYEFNQKMNIFTWLFTSRMRRRLSSKQKKEPLLKDSSSSIVCQ
jgi:hypothetical protein